jgi:pimeloyl-ACP methyl ester carboxylesterase
VLDLTPFRVEIPDAALDDLRGRLARARLPNQIEGIGWDQGTELGFLEQLLTYWRDGYDWRAQEARLNALDHVLAEADGQRIHAIHARSPEPDALPLLLVHGWPGSVAEFLDAIGPLTDPGAHGGDPRDAFHVVVPSLPGFGFSGPTATPGWHPRRIASAFADLMDALGYKRYGAQGGDWGSVVSTNVADLKPEAVVGLHLNFVTVRAMRGDDAPELTAEEQANLERLVEWRRDGAGYQEIQGTRPQSLGYGLEDSPAGLCAWIVEKFRAWSDCDGDVERSFTKDQLLTNVMLYWVTGTATSSARIYWEMRQARRAAMPGGRVEVPTGIACFPGEITKFPRAWVEGRYNVTRWTDQPRGGHFAAMEVPDLFVDDVRAFFRTVRRRPRSSPSHPT